MRLFIFLLFLLFLACGLSPQLRTRPKPIARVGRVLWGVPIGRRIYYIGYERLG